MFTDINVCKDINYNFKEYLKSKNIKQTGIIYIYINTFYIF